MRVKKRSTDTSTDYNKIVCWPITLPEVPSRTQELYYFYKEVLSSMIK